MSRKSGKKTAFQGRAKQILIRLADNGAMTTTDLVEELGMTRPNTCTYLARLKEHAFVKTEQGAGDKRIRRHILTAKGREHMDEWQSESADCGETSGINDGHRDVVADQSVDDLLDECCENIDINDPEF